MVHGGIKFVQSLAALDVVDEYRLQVNRTWPVVAWLALVEYSSYVV